DAFTVTVGQQTTVDETLLPIGTLSGHFTDSAGRPVVGGYITVYDPQNHWVTSVNSDDTGAYTFPRLLAGDYKMEFARGDFSRVQYAQWKVTLEEADLITVPGGGTAVVDEQFQAPSGPTGTITGHFTKGGQPVSSGFAELVDQDFNFVDFQGLGTDGGFTFTEVPAGQY